MFVKIERNQEPVLFSQGKGNYFLGGVVTQKGSRLHVAPRRRFVSANEIVQSEVSCSRGELRARRQIHPADVIWCGTVRTNEKESGAGKKRLVFCCFSWRNLSVSCARFARLILLYSPKLDDHRTEEDYVRSSPRGLCCEWLFLSRKSSSLLVSERLWYFHHAHLRGKRLWGDIQFRPRQFPNGTIAASTQGWSWRLYETVRNIVVGGCKLYVHVYF